ncbi:MAG: N utilization substance protein B [Nitrospirales bacterium]|nr:MAG: N utilization substance protein B [Nitrospirales bacterium]
MNPSTLSIVSTAKKTTHHRSRRAARQLALQFLFQNEFQVSSSHSLGKFWEDHEAAPEVQLFTTQIIEGVFAHQKELDKLINDYAVEWSLSRMPVVDRNILRCALFELFWLPEVPAKVSINEALELAKRFADNESKRFLNGILDRIIQHESQLAEKRLEILSQRESRISQPKPDSPVDVDPWTV